MNRRDMLKMGTLLPIAPLTTMFSSNGDEVKTEPTSYDTSKYELDLERLVEMIRAEGVPCKIVEFSTEPFLDAAGKPKILKWKRMKPHVVLDMHGGIDEQYELYAKTAQELAIEYRSHRGEIIYISRYTTTPFVLDPTTFTPRKSVMINYAWGY